jgi:hypothetical protein
MNPILGVICPVVVAALVQELVRPSVRYHLVAAAVVAVEVLKYLLQLDL